jgi:hypothetical protein
LIACLQLAAEMQTDPLRDIDKFGAADSAEILNAPPGTVTTRLHRALRTLLEPHFASTILGL